jgi:hypothetical protein
MAGPVACMEEIINVGKFGKLEGRAHLRDLGVDVRIIFITS